MANLFVISGLSGAGKDSVIERLKKTGLDYQRIITTTTRDKRGTEKNGREYWFVSEKEFKDMVDNNEFLEWAKVYGNYYGNSRKAVNKALQSGKPVILRIDCQGAKTIKKKIPDAIVIFLTVSDLDIIKKRLKDRETETDKSIQRRLNQAQEELKTLNKWDYIVENKQNELDQTVEKVKTIIKKEFNK